MKKLYLPGLLLAFGSAHCAAATQTIDCGRLLDVKSGAWVEKVSIVIEDGTIKSVGPTTAPGSCRRLSPAPTRPA